MTEAKRRAHGWDLPMIAGFIVAVVDDDVRVLESLESLLESAGYSVRLFSSASALLQSGCLTEIHCLISDIGMPVMNGFELQEVVNVTRPALPVILITGRSEATQQQPGRGDGYGHRGFFRKPFNGQELLAAISVALQDA